MHDRILEVAKSWVGTPFHHQQCLKGHGVDCVQLVTAVGVELGLCDPIPIYQCDYGKNANPRLLLNRVKQYVFEIKEEEKIPGDLVMIAWRDNMPMHFAIYSGENKIIHASNSDGKVVEININNVEIFHSFWRYLGLKND